MEKNENVLFEARLEMYAGEALVQVLSSGRVIMSAPVPEDKKSLPFGDLRGKILTFGDLELRERALENFDILFG